jgi:hypothetical protein
MSNDPSSESSGEVPVSTETAVTVVPNSAVEGVQGAPQERAPVEMPPLRPGEDIVVIAKSPEEMATAQHALVGWCDSKISVMEMEAREAAENVNQAQKRKWKVAPFRKTYELAQGRVAYYQRMKAVLEAGYVIVPDMPAQTLVIRTGQREPRHQKTDSTYYGHTLPQAKSDGAPVGKGQYVSPEYKRHNWDTSSKDSAGRESITHHSRVRGFDTEFAFPMLAVKPQVLDEVGKAMALKVFDEIGILPAGSGPKKTMMRATTMPDPIVVGRIVRYEGAKRIVCSFLITWWLDSRTL